jgi:hypothetical protein
MARSRLKFGLLATAALLMTGPAAAQFGSIFSEPPPRPPADVPSGPPPERQGPPPHYYPTRRDLPPPRSDVPPAEPLPAPMSLPPSSRPGGGTIEQQQLPPPPGAQQAPPPQPGQENASRGPIQTLPGLPPGQRQPQGTPQQQQPQQQQPASQTPTEEVVVAPPPERISNPTAVFSGLDKITGRTTSFDVAINETVQFGALQVTPRVCYSRPPTETPQTDAFVEVDEVTLQGTIKRIFTGWMFAASPGLHAVDHPIYDVWLTDCKGGKLPAVAEVPQDEQAPAAARPAAKPKPQRAQPRAQQRGFLPTLR